MELVIQLSTQYKIWKTESVRCSCSYSNRIHMNSSFTLFGGWFTKTTKRKFQTFTFFSSFFILSILFRFIFLFLLPWVLLFSCFRCLYQLAAPLRIRFADSLYFFLLLFHFPNMFRYLLRLLRSIRRQFFIHDDIFKLFIGNAFIQRHITSSHRTSSRFNQNKTWMNEWMNVFFSGGLSLNFSK